jgi:hypothetical protein
VPIMFVWLKSLLFYLLKRELFVHVSVTEMFVIDTAFSVLFMFLSAFVVIHSLTKSFELKRFRDPLYDIMKDSEFFHLWVSHLVFNFGIAIVVSCVSITNIFIPMTNTIHMPFFWFLVGAGIVMGMALFVSIWLSNFSANFVRLMKLLYGLLFSLHAVLYLVLTPGFNNQYGIFWTVLMGLGAFVFCSLFFERFEKPMSWLERLHYKFFKT